jgi:ParB-like nuclease domain
MAIVATLNESENRHAPSAHSIASIPLNKLVPWDGNVRKTGAADGLEDLTANIAAHGVLQSLVVRKTNRGKFAIIAGRRRFLALSSLAEAGTIAPDAPVPCRIVPGFRRRHGNRPRRKRGARAHAPGGSVRGLPRID